MEVRSSRLRWTIRSRDRVDFKIQVMSRRKFHIIADPESPFQHVWDEDL